MIMRMAIGWLVMTVILGCAGPTEADRVAAAAKRVNAGIDIRIEELKLGAKPDRLFLRAFKSERTLELWVGAGNKPMQLFRTYPIAAMSGGLGPKRKEGDRQVPEGVYRVNRFNPQSKFHLSLGLDYPNASDLVRSDPTAPGGDIFIHGDRKSIGCLAMTDPVIEEIYVLALRLKRRQIAVHIFPCRMEGKGYAQNRKSNYQLAAFWKELEPIYRAFESERKVPKVSVTKSGAYQIR